ncbi:MAG: TonB-dependent receptor [Deltaproteobacteria bacterium]|jgi:vitamin B12 transporter|nr:TonB-dependent receptor [Deltaproteobacteria bacterium]
MVSSENSTQNQAGMMQPIVVSTDRLAETTREVSSHVTVITEEKLAQVPAERLDRILQSEGFFIRDYPGQNSSSVKIRGFGTSQYANDAGLSGDILLLIDGHLSGASNIARIMKVNIERVEVIRGPAALQYGASAMGGVINVITKKGQEEFQAQGKVGIGSFSYLDQSLALGGRQGDFDYSFGLFHSKNGNFTDAKGRTMYGTDDKSLYSGNVNFGYNFLDDRHRLGIVVNFYDDHVKGIGGYQERGPSTPNGYYNLSDVNTMDRQNQMYDFLYTGMDAQDFLSWHLRYFKTRDRSVTYSNTTSGNLTHNYYYPTGLYPPTRDRSAPNILLYKSDTLVDGGQAQLTADWGKIKLTGGADYTKYDIATGNMNITDKAGFLISQIKFLDENLILNGGLRYDTYNNELSGRTASVDNWTPAFGVAYHIWDFVKLRANYSRGFHLPTPSQLTSDGTPSGGFRTVGNPDLKPATTESWEFGFDLAKPAWNFNLTYFHTKYKDQIRLVTTDRYEPGPIRLRTYENTKEPTTYAGLEFGGALDIGYLLELPMTAEFYANGNTFFTRRAWNTAQRRFVTDLNNPKWIVSYGINLDYPDQDLYANLNFNYIGSSFENYYGNGWGHPGYRSGDTYPYPAYTIASFSVKKGLYELSDKSKLSLDLYINNLFGEYYEPTLDYPAQGRSFYVALRWDYK